MLDQGALNKEDFELIKIIDELKRIAKAIFEHYEGNGFEATADEAEILLQL